MMGLADTPEETLENKRARLPESLRDIPLTDVEAVASLPVIFQKPLADAYAMQKIDLSRAINYIKTSNNLFFSPEEIIEAARAEDSAPVSAGAETKDAVPQPIPAAPSSEVESFHSWQPVEMQPVPTMTPQLRQTVVQPTQEDLDRLTHLLMTGFPDMPRVSAEALADADLLSEVLAVVAATRLALHSKNASSEFLLMTLLFLFDQSTKEIQEIILGKPAIKKLIEGKGFSLK